MIVINVTLNQLPAIGNAIPVFMTAILEDASINQVTITSLAVLYGNVVLQQPNSFISNDPRPIALLATGTYDGVEYIGILYTNAVVRNQTPDNLARILQKLPLGIFNAIDSTTLIGQDMAARALMADDYYVDYFNVVNQVYSFNYSAALEYQYNGTVGLLSESTYPTNLFLWFSSLNTVALNSYDLELAISEYIFYRIGISCPVYINDHVEATDGYWNLGIPGYTELDSTTILAPDSFTPALFNLGWIIYNSSSFSDEFKAEITALILRISRADIGNEVVYSAIVDPTDDGFTLIGYTYPNDRRTIYGKCTQYLGINQYPLNIVAYVKL